MAMSFLDAVAEYFHSQREWELSRTAFVFPNQRSALFFKEIMKRLTKGHEELAPKIFITMAELMEKAAGLSRATMNQRLIWLYVAYCRVRKRHPNPDGSPSRPEEFDRFRYWGEMLLRDFDEIDRYLVDQRQLFRNIRNFKSLQSAYLTPEQLEIIKTYWGEDPYWGHLDQAVANPEADDDIFWRHMAGPDGATGRFAMLWELLGEVYDEFHSILVGHGRKCYPGMAFRIAANKVKRGDMADFSSEQYAFIGFSDVSPAELTVMDALQKRGRAIFFWDYDPTLVGPDACGQAGRFVAKYLKHFPQPTELEGIYPDKRKVNIVASASNSGQTALALQSLTPESVLVLPSDDLLLPMLSAIPDSKFPIISVSMGYPLRLTDMASLFSTVVSLQLRIVTRSDGSFEFFRDDVMAVISHPLVALNYPKECQAIVDHLSDNFLFNLPAADVAGSEFESLAPLFSVVADSRDLDSVMECVDNLLSFMERMLERNPGRKLDARVCGFLRKQTAELKALIAANPEVAMKKNTYFHLLESALVRRPVQLTGTKTEGLQILGLLETRALSFDNVVMLSMSDRMFPGKRQLKSFVPVTLRRGFGLPTPDVDEANMAYNFYRLISHASTSTLIFDSRTGKLKSGDMSRYLYQLRFLRFKNVEVSYSSAAFGPISPKHHELPANSGVGIVKTDEVMARLNRFLDPVQIGKYALSATALKHYINCPLSFYLEHVADIKIPDPPTDDTDAATLGSIFHAVAERLYSRMRDDGMNPINQASLKETVESPLLNDEIRRAINIHKLKIPEWIPAPDGSGKKIENPEVNTRPLSHEDGMLAKIAREMIVLMSENEPQEFSFLHAEYSKRLQWTPLATVMPPFNFTMSIDRIDSIPLPSGDSKVRIIDYKTGSDRTGFTDVDSLMTASVDKHLGGIFQLLLYCCAYADITGDHSTQFQPLIYPVKKLGDPSQTILKVGVDPKKRDPLADYHMVEDEYRLKLAEKIAEIFDPAVPFSRCNGSVDKACRYCKYLKICGVC